MIYNGIQKSKEKVNQWLIQNNSESSIFGVKKPSSFYEKNPYKSMLLPATYNATHCAVLTGLYKDLNVIQKQEIIDFILSFRGEDDYFHMPGVDGCSIVKDTNPFDQEYVTEYVNFHVSNYSLGALSSLGYDVSKNLSFLAQYNTIEKLDTWMTKRNWDDPWAEGNFVVNIASFYLMAMQNDNNKYLPMLEYLLDWHDKNQDPRTGYWGTDKEGFRDTQEHAMAGAAHNFHLYYYMNKPLKYVDKIIDYCIDYIDEGVRSACLDVDVVDVLAHLHVYNYRRNDIESSLERYTYKLLQFQNSDGGFCDIHKGIRRFDSWVCGYWEPQGLSNCFATWFRMATLGMIDSVLFPERQNEWTFRNTIGIGYFNKNYQK